MARGTVPVEYTEKYNWKTSKKGNRWLKTKGNNIITVGKNYYGYFLAYNGDYYNCLNIEEAEAIITSWFHRELKYDEDYIPPKEG